MNRYASFVNLHDVWHLDATAQTDLIHTHQMTSQQLIDQAIARIERLNTQINAIITPMFDATHERAARMDETAEYQAPFSNVPLLMKDACLQIEDTPYYLNTHMLRDLDHRSTFTTKLAQRFDHTKFVVLDKTNMPAMSSDMTEPLTFDATRNP